MVRIQVSEMSHQIIKLKKNQINEAIKNDLVFHCVDEIDLGREGNSR